MHRPAPGTGILVAALLLAPVPGAQALRVATYNILNYSSGRTSELQAVVAEFDADVLVVQEILSLSAVNTFLTTVLDVVEPGVWAAGDFVNGSDTDNALYFRTDRVTYLSHFVISTALRDIDEWSVRPLGYDSPDANLRLYVVHLKASQGTENQNKRLAEVTAMRTRMESFPLGQHYLVLGDFNIYTSSEPAYGYMLGAGAGTAGIVEDPISTPGNWHNSATFASIHTQSPRTTQFGGGANGGMDDRFDMILTAPAFLDGNGYEVLPATYTALGQDGQHFNGALNVPPFTVVTQEVAEALHDGSDHLPVFADFQVPAILIASATVDFGTVITGATADSNVDVENGAAEPGDTMDYDFVAPAGFSAPTGPFEAEVLEGPNTHTLSMDTSTPGVMGGDLEIQTDAPGDENALVPLSGTVLDHAMPSVEAEAVVSNGAIDFGTHPIGDFTDQSAAVFNADHGALQALLDVYDGVIVGDTRFSLAGGFAPASVDDTPATWDVAFDDAGAADGLYMATLTFSTRDQQDLLGAIDLADVVYDLTAEVADVVGLPEPTLVHVTGFGMIAPNPFRPLTTIDVSLAVPGELALTVFDVGGRLVRTLAGEWRTGGLHRIEWDGRDDDGRDVGSGIFYARLRTGRTIDTRVLVRVR